MKLNFWQWLGVLCVVLGLIGYLAFREQETTGPADVQPNPTVDDQEVSATQPAAD